MVGRKLCHSYRLVCLKAMNPEECYERKVAHVCVVFGVKAKSCFIKMANQEYGEALELARRYELDCDLVY